jgi:hypothetical protein
VSVHKPRPQVAKFFANLGVQLFLGLVTEELFGLTLSTPTTMAATTKRTPMEKIQKTKALLEALPPFGLETTDPINCPEALGSFLALRNPGPVKGLIDTFEVFGQDMKHQKDRKTMALGALVSLLKHVLFDCDRKNETCSVKQGIAVPCWLPGATPTDLASNTFPLKMYTDVAKLIFEKFLDTLDAILPKKAMKEEDYTREPEEEDAQVEDQMEVDKEEEDAQMNSPEVDKEEEEGAQMDSPEVDTEEEEDAQMDSPEVDTEEEDAQMDSPEVDTEEEDAQMDSEEEKDTQMDSPEVDTEEDQMESYDSFHPLQVVVGGSRSPSPVYIPSPQLGDAQDLDSAPKTPIKKTARPRKPPGAPKKKKPVKCEDPLPDEEENLGYDGDAAPQTPTDRTTKTTFSSPPAPKKKQPAATKKRPTKRRPVSPIPYYEPTREEDPSTGEEFSSDGEGDPTPKKRSAPTHASRAPSKKARPGENGSKEKVSEAASMAALALSTFVSLGPHDVSQCVSLGDIRAKCGTNVSTYSQGLSDRAAGKMVAVPIKTPLGDLYVCRAHSGDGRKGYVYWTETRGARKELDKKSDPRTCADIRTTIATRSQQEYCSKFGSPFDPASVKILRGYLSRSGASQKKPKQAKMDLDDDALSKYILREVEDGSDADGETMAQ